MKKTVAAAFILMCGSGYARTQVSLNVGIGFPVYCERPVYVEPVYCPPPPPVRYVERCYPAPVVVYVDRDHGYRHDGDHRHGYDHHDGHYRGYGHYRH